MPFRRSAAVHAAAALLALPVFLAPGSAAQEPASSAVSAPVLKWQRGGCFSS